MKLAKQELLDKINTLEIDDDTKISLLEDITDSFEESVDVVDEEKEQMKADIERLEAELRDMKQKYKERFLSGEVKEEVEDNGLEEKEVIDIKEI